MFYVVHTSKGLRTVPHSSMLFTGVDDVWFSGTEAECEDYILDMYTVDCSDIDSYVEPMDN